MKYKIFVCPSSPCRICDAVIGYLMSGDQGFTFEQVLEKVNKKNVANNPQHKNAIKTYLDNLVELECLETSVSDIDGSTIYSCPQSSP